ncbi:MAG: hypothetical protein ACLQD8_03695 [Thermoplasmata archaeon]
MRLEPTLLREGGEHPLPKHIGIPVAQPRGRPRYEYRLHIDSEDDAETARRHGVPLHPLTSNRVTNLGYPITFPTRLVVAEAVLPLVDTTLGTIRFVSEVAARSPRPEDTAVAMLQFDMIGARALLDRNPKWDPMYLTRRIWEEGLGRRATFVRFFDVLPHTPTEGESIGRAALERKLRKNSAGTGT